MLKFCFGFLCSLLIKDVHSCIPMRPMDDPITFPPQQFCMPPPGAASLYLENEVELIVGQSWDLGMKNAIGECQIKYRDGSVKYFDGNTPVNWDEATRNASIGFWDRTNCPNACVCTSMACYRPVAPGPNFPSGPPIYFYPHCNFPTECFVVAIFYNDGSLENPGNPTDRYTTAAQDASGTDVNNPTYPKVTKVGCSGCPVIM